MSEQQFNRSPATGEMSSQVDAACDSFERAWQQGPPPRLEDFLAACDPQMAPSLLRELLTLEVEYRRKRGETPRLDDYRGRFARYETVVVGCFQQTKPEFEAPAGTIRFDLLPREFAQYRIERKLGAGGMGTVYLATDVKLDRKVAIKVPHFSGSIGDDARKRFWREAKAAARIRHPNLCPVFEVGEIDGVEFLVMAYVEGATLKIRDDKGRVRSQKQTVRIIGKLARALSHLHEQGIVHRDLKPENIIVDGRGEPIVMDFGLAKSMEELRSRLTQDGALLGTPAYMSPEQGRGRIDAIGPASDVYTLGVILYEMLTGVLPWQGGMHEIIAQIVDPARRPEPPSVYRPNLDPELERSCLKALEKDVALRYPTMQEFANDLQRHLSSAPSGMTEVVPAPALSGKRKAMLVAELCLALLALYTVFSSRGRGTPADPTPAATDVARNRVTAPLETAAPVVGPEDNKPPAEGRVQIVLPVDAQNAHVSINGAAAEPGHKFELPRTLRPGRYRLDVDDPRYYLKRPTYFDVKVGDNPVVRVPLALRPAKLRLNLSKKLSGLSIQIDERTLSNQELDEAIELTAGTHELSAVAAGYKSMRLKLLLEPGSSETQSIALERVEPATPIRDPGFQRSDNALEMIFCWCPPGEFVMGSPEEEEGRRGNEAQVGVRLTRGFWLAKYETTQAQWQKVMAPTGLKDPNSFEDRLVGNEKAWGKPDYPAINIGYAEAREFCKRLTAMELQAGRLDPGTRFDLPTEAQWEYACRAGSRSAFFFEARDRSGNDKLGAQLPMANLIPRIRQFGWLSGRTGSRSADDDAKFVRRFQTMEGEIEMPIHAVGKLLPNPWGFHDIIGNVPEWCRDVYEENVPGGDDPEFVGKPGLQDRKVVRGGRPSSPPSDFRSAYRTWRRIGEPPLWTGFRAALVEAAMESREPLPSDAGRKSQSKQP